MFKSLRIALSLILAAFVLPACTKKQDPTPVDSTMGTSSNDLGDSIIPAGDGTGWGTDLEPRALGDGIDLGANTYNGRQMVTGVLQPVYFEFDSSSISASERSKLQNAANHLMDNPSDGLLMEGHCDWYGTEDYNLALGDRRANSARDYLATLGISTDRIDTLSKGSLEATAGLAKSESAQDRRVELIILK
jgi:peptidoglycan-associated lipoprotein